MPNNYPGPFEVELSYSVGALTHVMRFNTDVVGTVEAGDSPTSITLATRQGTGKNLNLAVADLITVLKVRYASDITFDSYTLWKYQDSTFIRSFITSEDLAIAGTSTGDTVLCHQTTLTFRTAEGGIMRTVMLEDVDDSNVSQPYSQGGTGNKAIMDEIADDDTWVLARDTSYPIAKLNIIGGQNEKTFKTRFR